MYEFTQPWRREEIGDFVTKLHKTQLVFIGDVESSAGYIPVNDTESKGKKRDGYLSRYLEWNPLVNNSP